MAIKHFEATFEVYVCICDCMLRVWPFGAWSALCPCYTMLTGSVVMCCAASYGPMRLLVAQ